MSFWKMRMSIGPRAPAVKKDLARPSLTAKVSNNPFLGETNSVRTFYDVTDLPVHEDGDNSDNHDAETGDPPSPGGPKGPSADVV
jgi:hypothetical protein